MELRNLNTFLKVASLQNFTQASRELGISRNTFTRRAIEWGAAAGHTDRVLFTWHCL